MFGGFQSTFRDSKNVEMLLCPKMDISIMKSDVDFKDPEALAAREKQERAPLQNTLIQVQW